MIWLCTLSFHSEPIYSQLQEYNQLVNQPGVMKDNAKIQNMNAMQSFCQAMTTFTLLSRSCFKKLLFRSFGSESYFTNFKFTFRGVPGCCFLNRAVLQMKNLLWLTGIAKSTESSKNKDEGVERGSEEEELLLSSRLWLVLLPQIQLFCHCDLWKRQVQPLAVVKKKDWAIEELEFDAKLVGCKVIVPNGFVIMKRKKGQGKSDLCSHVTNWCLWCHLPWLCSG